MSKPPILNALGLPISDPARIELTFKAPYGFAKANGGLKVYWKRPAIFEDKESKAFKPIWTSIPVRKKKIVLKDYRASGPAWLFHTSPSRFRFLVWGMRGGKTVAGAVETVRAALALAGELHWIVAPTYRNLQQPEAEILRILTELEIGFVKRHARKEIRLDNGSVLQFCAAEFPNVLLGPTIRGSVWVDEAAFCREESYYNLRTRIMNGDAGMWCTTSPNGRNWFWAISREAGLPANQRHGEFQNKYAFVSHRATYDFSWSPKREIDAFRRTWPRRRFEQKIEARFTSPDLKAFTEVEKCLTLEPPPKQLEGATCMGVDLAQKQDYTAVVVMDADGRVHHVARWTGESWRRQIALLIGLAQRWNAVICYDNSNIGSVVGEELEKTEGITALPVECNAPQTKIALIEGLQLAFERHLLKLPDPHARWAPPASKALLEELDNYEPSLTRGGKLSYSCPKGEWDDLVMALALANWGRSRGVVGGLAPALIAVPRSEWNKIKDEKRAKDLARRLLRRPKPWNPHRWHRNKLGLPPAENMWR